MSRVLVHFNCDELIKRALKTSSRLTEQGLKLKTRHNQKVQTDVHILPPYVDKNYTSSVWELKRRALHLVSQTVSSIFKNIRQAKCIFLRNLTNDEKALRNLHFISKQSFCCHSNFVIAIFVITSEKEFASIIEILFYFIPQRNFLCSKSSK